MDYLNRNAPRSWAEMDFRARQYPRMDNRPPSNTWLDMPAYLPEQKSLVDTRGWSSFKPGLGDRNLQEEQRYGKHAVNGPVLGLQSFIEYRDGFVGNFTENALAGGTLRMVQNNPYENPRVLVHQGFVREAYTFVRNLPMSKTDQGKLFANVVVGRILADHATQIRLNTTPRQWVRVMNGLQKLDKRNIALKQRARKAMLENGTMAPVQLNHINRSEQELTYKLDMLLRLLEGKSQKSKRQKAIQNTATNLTKRATEQQMNHFLRNEEQRKRAEFEQHAKNAETHKRNVNEYDAQQRQAKRARKMNMISVFAEDAAANIQAVVQNATNTQQALNNIVSVTSAHQTGNTQNYQLQPAQQSANSSASATGGSFGSTSLSNTQNNINYQPQTAQQTANSSASATGGSFGSTSLSNTIFATTVGVVNALSSISGVVIGGVSNTFHNAAQQMAETGLDWEQRSDVDDSSSTTSGSGGGGNAASDQLEDISNVAVQGDNTSTVTDAAAGVDQQTVQPAGNTGNDEPPALEEAGVQQTTQDQIQQLLASLNTYSNAGVQGGVGGAGNTPHHAAASSTLPAASPDPEDVYVTPNRPTSANSAAGGFTQAVAEGLLAFQNLDEEWQEIVGGEVSHVGSVIEGAALQQEAAKYDYGTGTRRFKTESDTAEAASTPSWLKTPGDVQNLAKKFQEDVFTSPSSTLIPGHQPQTPENALINAVGRNRTPYNLNALTPEGQELFNMLTSDMLGSGSQRQGGGGGISAADVPEAWRPYVSDFFTLLERAGDVKEDTRRRRLHRILDQMVAVSKNPKYGWRASNEQTFRNRWNAKMTEFETIMEPTPEKRTRAGKAKSKGRGSGKKKR